MDETQRRECGWCGTVTQEGIDPPSHTMCEGCFHEHVIVVLNQEDRFEFDCPREPLWAYRWRDWGGEA